MSKDVTVEILVRKTFNVEVDDDFDFEDEDALNRLIQDTDNNESPDYEDWEESSVFDDEEGEYYYL